MADNEKLTKLTNYTSLLQSSLQKLSKVKLIISVIQNYIILQINSYFPFLFLKCLESPHSP